MNESIKMLVELGYDKKYAEEIVNYYPINTLTDMTLKNNIKRNYKFLLNLGYTKEEIIKMTKSLPSLYGLSEENITNKINFLIKQGYSKEEVIKITKTLPALYSYSEETITNKINFLIKQGYSKEEVIKMIKTLPALYGISEENIEEKIEYYKEKGLEFIITEDTKQLMQSMKKTKARYNYLTEVMLMDIDESNYRRLFYDEKKFQKTYGVSTDSLIKTYGLEPNVSKLINE